MTRRLLLAAALAVAAFGRRRGAAAEAVAPDAPPSVFIRDGWILLEGDR